MRLWYIKRQNVAILNTRMLLLFGASLVALLAWLMPQERAFRDMLANGEADQVSIAYARLLLSIYPEDGELRGLLAGQYFQVGQHYRAWDVLSGHDEERSVIGIKVLRNITYGWPEGERRQRWEARLAETLEALVGSGEGQASGIETEFLPDLARIAGSLDQPLIAARLRDRIYRVTRTDRDLALAVRAWLAADLAENAYQLLARRSDTQSEELVDLRIFVAQVTDRPLAALAAVDDYVATVEPSSGQWVRFANVALAANDPAKLREYLARVGDVSALTLAEATQLSRAAIASGALDQAIELMRHALALGGDQPELSARMAQVHEWTGEAEAALAMWSKLARRHADPQALDRAWRLARGLHQYTNTSFLLSKLSEVRLLTDEEVYALRLSHEQCGAPLAGEQTLKRYLESYPQHGAAWRELVALQEGNQTLLRVEETWQGFAQHHAPALDDVVRRAHSLWRSFKAEEALEVLLSWQQETSPLYWQRLAAYAWFLDDRERVGGALEKLLADREQLGSYQFERLIQSARVSDPLRALDYARKAYDTFPDRPEFLLDALRIAVESEADDEAAALIAQISGQSPALERILGLAEFWNLKARHLQRRGDLLGARSALAQALVLGPEDAGLQASMIWLLVAQQDMPALASALKHYGLAANDSSILWPALASGYKLLEDDQQAIFWYAKALPEHADDIGLLLAYSSSLESLGRRDPAFRLRQFALDALLANARTTGDLDVDSLMWTARGLLSAPKQKALLLRLIDAAGTDELIGSSAVRDARATFELADSLRRQHYSAARYWLQQSDVVSPSAELAIAVDAHDKAALTALLAHENREVRTQAALALGDSALARSISRRNNQAAIAAPYSGWQALPQFSKQGNVSRYGSLLRARGRLAKRRYEADLIVEDVTIDGHDVTRNYREVTASGRVHYDNYVGAGAVNVHLVAGGERRFAGVSVTQGYRLDRRNSFQARAILREPVPGGGVTGALLDRSGVDLSGVSALTRRQEIAGRLSWYQYRGPDDRVAGDSKSLEITHTLSLLRSGVSANLRSFLVVQDSSQRPTAVEVDRLLQNPGDNLLPADTRTIGMGLTVWRELPGELGWRRSTPHYRLETQLGYQWPQRQLTYSADLALGIAVFGRDELSLSAGLANSVQNVEGQTNLRAALGYSRQLDW